MFARCEISAAAVENHFVRLPDLLRPLRPGSSPVDSDELDQAIRQGDFRRVASSERLSAIPGMISPDERQLLSFMAERAWQPGTQIVDGGSFLGASTRALLEGLKRSPSMAAFDAPSASLQRPPIDAFDLYQANAYMCDEFFAEEGLVEGDSFRPQFEANLAPEGDLVRVHEADLRESNWVPAPISVLFLDVIWSWDINRYVMEQFYTRLTPETSWVIHQDYVYAWYPWIPITMEYFSDNFEFVADVPLATAVFRCKRPLDEAQARIDLLEALAPKELLRLMDRAIARFEGWPRGVLECARAQLLRYVGREAEARKQLARVLREHAEHEAPVRFAREIESHIDNGWPPRLV